MALGPEGQQPVVRIFRLNFILFSLAGIWPPDGLNSVGLGVYVFLSVITHAFFFVSNISFTMGMILTSTSLNAALGACSDVLVLYLTTYKIIVMLKNRKLIRHLVHSLKYDFDIDFPSVRAECRQVDEHFNRRARKLTGLYYLVLLSVDATYFYMFMLAELRDQPRMPQWYPVDMRHISTFTWTIHCLVVLSAALVSGIHTTVFDTTLLSFSFLLGGKIDNLGRLLTTLEKVPEGVELSATEHAERVRRLHTCVRIHQRIIRFVDELESALSSLSLAQLLESLATVCLQAYRLTYAPPTVDEAFPMFVFFVWLVIQLWILCWSGENIALKSSSLANTAARCYWLGAPRDFNIAMRMLILRAQRPLCLTALKMVKLNCSVFLDIIKNSYSLYTCMLRMTSSRT